MSQSITGAEAGALEVKKKSQTGGMRQKIAAKMKIAFIEKGWLFYIVGFLLGRAVILTEVSPFAVAFIATVWFIQRKRVFPTMFSVLAGAITYSIPQSIFIATAMVIFVLLAAICKNMKHQQMVIPLLVFVSTAAPRLFLYSVQAPLTSYEWMLLLVEGVLGSVLVLIFMQTIPLISPKRYKPILKNEEIVCMIILIASVLTGTIGWQLYGASIEQIFSRYFVLVFSFVGGAAIGSTVGVVVGLILTLANVGNLYQMSLLAFSGLLGGLLREGKRIGVSCGLLVGTLMLGIFGGVGNLLPTMAESAIAIVLFFLTPASWFRTISRYIPGTEEYSNEQDRYSQKVRNMTAKRVGQFSDVFQALSKSFNVPEAHKQEVEEEDRQTDIYLSQVTEKTCQHCFMKDHCWQKNFDHTYTLMEEIAEDIFDERRPNRQTMYAFENHCVKSKKVIDVMKNEMVYFEANRKLKAQVAESKRLVSDQLQGVSGVMDDFAHEILKERQYHENQEMQIVHALHSMGMEIEKIDIYQLEKGNADIEILATFHEYRGEGTKLIAPMLSDILNEMIIIKKEEISPFPNGTSYLSFGSAKEFVVETGAANAAKGGGFVSGDSYTTMELGEGKFAVAISDGMGNGERAREESKETLRLLQQILLTGIPEEVAIKSINSILSLRTSDEMFATLDLAVIDLHNAYSQFLKIGSTPSFVKRKNKMFKIEGSNLPIGIVQEFDVDIVNEHLKAEDLLIMMSDGIFEGPKHVENIDLWLKRKLREMKTDDPQEIADLILEEVVRTRSGFIDDDMTVVVSKIKRNTPEWAPIPVVEDKAQ